MNNEYKTQEVGTTAEHAWMLEFLNRCFPESEDHLNADLKLAMAMCQAEPKHAQFTMQWLAQEIRSGNHDTDRLIFFSFSLGALVLAYLAVAQAEGRCAPDGVPPELESILKNNPEIVECVNKVSELKFLDDKDE